MNIGEQHALQARRESVQLEADQLFAKLTDPRAKERFQREVFFHLDDVRVVVFGYLNQATMTAGGEEMWLAIGNATMQLAEAGLNYWRSLISKYGDRLRFY